jgi:hypothetical protein
MSFTSRGLASSFLVLAVAVSGCREESGARYVDSATFQKLRADAAARSPADVAIPWPKNDKPFTKVDATKRFGRFIRNALWQRLADISALAIEKGDAELLAMGRFYQAYLRGRDIASGEATKEEVFTLVKEAVDAGFRNPHEIAGAEPPRTLHTIDEFRTLIAELETEFQTNLVRETKRLVDQELELSAQVDLGRWAPDLTASNGEKLWREGRPMLVVVTRIHHDGFKKLLADLHPLEERLGDRLPMAVVFYQYDGGDAERRKQTEDYAGRIALRLPYAVIDRAEYKSLVGVLNDRHAKLEAARKRKNNPFNPFEPLGLFVDAERKARYVSRGVITDWELDYIAEKLLEKLGAGAGDGGAKQPLSEDSAVPDRAADGGAGTESTGTEDAEPPVDGAAERAGGGVDGAAEAGAEEDEESAPGEAAVPPEGEAEGLPEDFDAPGSPAPEGD